MRTTCIGLLIGLLAASAAEVVLHHSFNEGTGKVVRDRSGKGLHARRLGGRYVKSARGLALRLDGVDDRLEFPDFGLKGMPTSFTLLVRLRVDPEAKKDTTRLIFGDIAGLSVQRNFNLKLDRHNRIHAEWGNGESYIHVHAPAVSLAGGWHTLAVVGDAERKLALLFVDGKEVGRAEMAYGPKLVLGAARFRSGYWSPANAFGGELDDLKVYDGALTEEEIGVMNRKVATADLKIDSQLEEKVLPKVGMGQVTSRQGLVANYTFAAGTGTRLVDHSGRGNHGEIHGAVWVDSPWGKALRFDGKDDYVDLGQPDDFWFDDSLTIEMWVKTIRPDPPRGHPLLIGSSAEDLAVERHFNMRLDHTGFLRFEWGDTSRCREVLTDPWFLDGEWRHVAAVFAANRALFIYVNGTCVEARRVALPLARTRGDSIHIGGWDHGYLQGDVAGVRVHSRALAATEVQASAGFARKKRRPVLKLAGYYSYQQQVFVAEALWSVADQAVAEAEFQVLDAARKRVLGSSRLAGVELAKALRECSTRVVIPGKGSGKGDHHLRLTLRDGDGGTVLSTEAPIPYVAPPDWLTSRAGTEDVVLPPYTPCRLAVDGEEKVVSVWGRNYRFGKGTVLAGAESGGVPLLRGPVELVAEAGGRAVHWQPDSPVVTKQKPTGVNLRTQWSGAGLRTDLATMVEYDGFIRFDCRIEATAATRLGRLELRIPLTAKHARLLHAWPMDRGGFSGALEANWAASFRPVVWIGNEERGLSWVCESERDWFPADRERAMEVVFVEGKPTLVCHLVGQTRQLRVGDTLLYTFGLQATPVRPMARTFWDMRVHRSTPYANEYQWPRLQVDGKPKLDHLADSGARALLVWRWWDVFGHPLPFGHEKRFPDLVKACHKAGIQVVPYAIGFLLSDAMPEYRTFRADMLVEPEKPFVGVNRLPGLPPQIAYFVCPNSSWCDFVTAKTAECMDRYDTDGVYLDTTVRPEPCTNQLHGCGWERPDGSVAPTYPVLAIRDMMKRLYTIVLTRKPKGFVDAHVYDCLNVPALAFATGSWNGEQLQSQKRKLASLPLDRFRTEFMGHNIGVPADLLYYKLRDYEASTALAILHDVPVRCEKDADMAALAVLYRARDEFGCKQAQFHGYWEEGAAIAAATEGCWASYWQHPQNGLLVAVANTGLEKQAVQVGVDWGKLGVHPVSVGTEVRGGSVVRVGKSGFKVSLKPQSWGLVWLRRAGEGE